MMLGQSDSLDICSNLSQCTRCTLSVQDWSGKVRGVMELVWKGARWYRIGLGRCEVADLPPDKGTTHSLPTKRLNRSSSGLTATAVSPRIVSGRVVATGRESSLSARGYAKV